MECCILFLYVFYMLSPDAQWSRSLDKVVKPFDLIVKYFNIILLYRPGFRFPLYLGSHLLLLHSLLHSLFFSIT